MAERNASLDWIRAIAIIFVVIIHVFARYTIETPLSTPWLAALGVEAIVRVGLASFFVLSGYLLIRPFNSMRDIGRFYWRRAKRILPLFIVWSFVYFVYASHTLDVAEFARKVLAGPTEPHFWFIYSILGLYITTPFIANIVIAAKTRDLAIFCIAGSLSYTLEPLCGYLGVNLSMIGFYPIIWMIYYIAGHVIRRVCDERPSLPLGWLVCIYIASTIAIFFLSFYTTNAVRPLASIFDPRPYDLNITFFAATVIFFAVLRKYCVSPLPSFLKFIADKSYGIYLSHMIFIYIYVKYFNIQPWWLNVAGLFAFTMACCLALEWLASALFSGINRKFFAN